MNKPRESTGGAYEKRGAIFLRVTVAPQERRSERMPWVTPEAWHAHGKASPCVCVACARARDVQALVTLYRAAHADADMIEALVKSAASADATKLTAIRRAVDGFCAGRIPKAAPKVSAGRSVTGRKQPVNASEYLEFGRIAKDVRDQLVYLDERLRNRIPGRYDAKPFKLAHKAHETVDALRSVLENLCAEDHGDSVALETYAGRPVVGPVDKYAVSYVAFLEAEIERLKRGSTTDLYRGELREWSFSSLKSNHARTTNLVLGWEVNLSAFSDDYIAADVNATDLLDEYAYYVSKSQAGEDVLSIHWYVRSLEDGTFESAPFGNGSLPNFLNYYSWPIDVVTGERLDWLKLPVREYQWRHPGRSDKGGFIQEATGWTPSLFQQYVSIHTFFQPRGMRTPGNWNKAGEAP